MRRVAPRRLVPIACEHEDDAGADAADRELGVERGTSLVDGTPSDGVFEGPAEVPQHDPHPFAVTTRTRDDAVVVEDDREERGMLGAVLEDLPDDPLDGHREGEREVFELCQARVELVVSTLEHRAHESLASPEVVVERAHGHARAPCDLVHARLMQSAFREAGLRSV